LDDSKNHNGTLFSCIQVGVEDGIDLDLLRDRSGMMMENVATECIQLPGETQLTSALLRAKVRVHTEIDSKSTAKTKLKVARYYSFYSISKPFSFSLH
jgi:hypothetical protein